MTMLIQEKKEDTLEGKRLLKFVEERRTRRWGKFGVQDQFWRTLRTHKCYSVLYIAVLHIFIHTYSEALSSHLFSMTLETLVLLTVMYVLGQSANSDSRCRNQAPQKILHLDHPSPAACECSWPTHPGGRSGHWARCHRPHNPEVNSAFICDNPCVTSVSLSFCLVERSCRQLDSVSESKHCHATHFAQGYWAPSVLPSGPHP